MVASLTTRVICSGLLVSVQRFERDCSDRQWNECVRYQKGDDAESCGQVQGTARATASHRRLPLPEQLPHSPLRAGQSSWDEDGDDVDDDSDEEMMATCWTW